MQFQIVERLAQGRANALGGIRQSIEPIWSIGPYLIRPALRGKFRFVFWDNEKQPTIAMGDGRAHAHNRPISAEHQDVAGKRANHACKLVLLEGGSNALDAFSTCLPELFAIEHEKCSVNRVAKVKSRRFLPGGLVS